MVAERKEVERGFHQFPSNLSLPTSRKQRRQKQHNLKYALYQSQHVPPALKQYSRRCLPHVLVLRGDRFLLSDSQIRFDSPNCFTGRFLSNNYESTLYTDRKPDLFRTVVLEYLSGYDVFPVKIGSLSDKEAVKAVLAEAEDFKLKKLAEQARFALGNAGVSVPLLWPLRPMQDERLYFPSYLASGLCVPLPRSVTAFCSLPEQGRLVSDLVLREHPIAVCRTLRPVLYILTADGNAQNRTSRPRRASESRRPFPGPRDLREDTATPTVKAARHPRRLLDVRNPAGVGQHRRQAN